MLCHSEREGFLLGKGRQKEDPTHSAPNPNLATALEKPDPFPDPRQARRARPGMLISALTRAPGKHRCGRPLVAWRGQDPNRAGPGAAPSPCAPRCFPGETFRRGGCGNRDISRTRSVPGGPAPEGGGWNLVHRSLEGMGWGVGGSLTSLQGEPQRDAPAEGCRRGGGAAA